MNGWAIVSLTFLNKLHHVHRRVSITHSAAINGAAAKDAGALKSLW